MRFLKEKRVPIWYSAVWQKYTVLGITTFLRAFKYGAFPFSKFFRIHAARCFNAKKHTHTLHKPSPSIRVSSLNSCGDKLGTRECFRRKSVQKKACWKHGFKSNNADRADELSFPSPRPEVQAFCFFLSLFTLRFWRTPLRCRWAARP